MAMPSKMSPPGELRLSNTGSVLFKVCNLDMEGPKWKRHPKVAVNSDKGLGH